MLEITPTLQIPETEFTWTYARSGGPGGQNVNKVASKAVLRQGDCYVHGVASRREKSARGFSKGGFFTLDGVTTHHVAALP